jgi:hypothetical protein
MLTIWKYTIDLETIEADSEEFEMPLDAALLHVGPEPNDPTNNELICLWFHVNTDNALEKRRFYVFGTGAQLNFGARLHVGTVIIKPFAWHVFE